MATVTLAPDATRRAVPPLVVVHLALGNVEALREARSVIDLSPLVALHWQPSGWHWHDRRRVTCASFTPGPAGRARKAAWPAHWH